MSVLLQVFGFKKMISFDSKYLRTLWGIVETDGYVLQGLGDDDVCLWLLQKMTDTLHLDGREFREIETYILSRSHLIRQVAQS